MTKPKFTPGPWNIKSLGTKLYIKNGDNTVAEVWETYQIDFRQKIANASLIAAAPELYDALEEACELHCHGCLSEGACKVSYTEKPDEHCCIASWIKLLRKVRDGK